MTLRVSVVVPTYRRNDLLRRCLAALAAQDLDPDTYEILVVDDAASPATRQLVQGDDWRLNVMALAAGGEPSVPAPGPEAPTGARPVVTRPAKLPSAAAASGGGLASKEAPPTATAPTGIETVMGKTLQNQILSLPWLEAPQPEPERAAPGGAGAPGAPGGAARLPRVTYLPVATGPHGPAAARNLGWRAAEGEVVAFTDDDCIPVPGWLAGGLAAFTPPVIGVAGRIVMPLTGVPTDYELDATGLVRSEFVTANCFYRRSALALAGGFDERFRIAWREDSDLFFTLLRRWPNGFASAPEAVVVHPIRPASWGISLRQQRKNMFNALLFKKHRVLYQERFGARAPWPYYAIVAALLTVPVALLLDQGPTAAAGGIVWAALTLRLITHRLACTSRAPGHVAEMILTSMIIPPVALFWRLVGAIRYRVLFV